MSEGKTHTTVHFFLLEPVKEKWGKWNKFQRKILDVILLVVNQKEKPKQQRRNETPLDSEWKRMDELREKLAEGQREWISRENRVSNELVMKINHFWSWTIEDLRCLDGTWIHNYTPGTKDQSIRWVASGAFAAGKTKTVPSDRKVETIVLWDYQ